MADIFGRFGTALGFAVFCIYGILVLLYNNFLYPFAILAALPLSIGGAFLGLLVMQKELGKLNAKNIKQLHKQNLSVQQMAEENKTSTKTVKRHLQKLGISMKGAKKENTINQIKSYRKKHPKSTQKETSEALNLSIITVKRNWL